jgi:hypothetical protein
VTAPFALVRVGPSLASAIERYNTTDYGPGPSIAALNTAAFIGEQVAANYEQRWLATLAHNLAQGAFGESMRRRSWDQRDALIRAADRDVVEQPRKAEPVCKTCNDTHRMSLDGRWVMCTRCPLPCQRCRFGGNGPYCETTPCACDCHAKGAK